MIKGVIFDLDGVLVTTDELHYKGWSRLAQDEGIPFTKDDNQRQRGVSRMESLEILLEKAVRSYTDDEKREMAERKNTYYRAMLENLTPNDTLPGAREILRELRKRGIQTAVASASRNTPKILERTNLRDEVDAVADGNETTHSKPDPEVFLLAASKLDLAPDECIVVEDAAAGIEGGRRGGMAVFAIGPAERHPDVAHRAEHIADVTADQLLAAGEICRNERACR